MFAEQETRPMDIPISPPGTSEGSVYEDSTPPTTPASSPFFGASRGDELVSSSFPASPATSTLNSDQRVHDIPSVAALWRPSTGLVHNICVVGAGYVGGPTAAVLALHNPSIAVEVVDRDPHRIRRWKSPHLPVHEPGLGNVVRIARDGADFATSSASVAAIIGDAKRKPNLFFTCDSAGGISRADMVFLAVNTPTKTFGVGAGRATDMTAVDEAVREIALHAKPGAVIVEKSTVPCGTAQRIRQMFATLRPEIPVEVLSNPEFLSEGSAIDNLISPDRVLIGSSGTPAGRRAANMLASLYSTWVPTSRILEINSWSSELSKLVANAMLAQRISSINSISAICEKTGAEVDQVAKAVGMDTRIGPQFLKAGLGFGGSCFRKDIASLTYLAESLGLEDVAQYWNQVNVMNATQRNRFARKVIDRFDGNLRDRKIALLGFAFKKDTGDTRESLAADVVRLLMEERPTEIAIYDPYCQEEDILRELEVVLADHPNKDNVVKVLADPYLACSQAHAVLVMTDCDQFRNVPPQPRGRSLLTYQPSVARVDPEVYDSLAEVMMTPLKPEEETWTFNGISYRLAPQEACAADCASCRSISCRPATAEPLEWARIAYNLKEPKWVLDGRCFLDAREMEKLGIQLDTVGRQPGGSQSRRSSSIGI
ncbi:UDP-glucose/GDP-mannose dehydrogenase family, NAD binding domain-containing protein [Aspergillus bertholletiae]|uniref:UDP-glucose 6-dehydrogenase n=1 Tax=Aspergillus bertholletiae TaxID=1226010 RepID=A0A5N7BCS9_9EURO|nr:UDP-glucose/GDP-mannose dehydrogenase family, NAD binding domain-containing protein [Aspergillus bertholletiae]